jgi:hypothetical protein
MLRRLWDSMSDGGQGISRLVKTQGLNETREKEESWGLFHKRYFNVCFRLRACRCSAMCNQSKIVRLHHRILIPIRRPQSHKHRLIHLILSFLLSRQLDTQEPSANNPHCLFIGTGYQN